MNWYMETELRHGIEEWDILREGFLLTFSFEDDFASIDEALQEIKGVIFRMPQEPLEWVQPNWGTQLCHALECYNVTAKEDGAGSSAAQKRKEAAKQVAQNLAAQRKKEATEKARMKKECTAKEQEEQEECN